MIVAVVAMRMVKVSFHYVINVIAVWNRFVSAIRTVDVIIGMASAAMRRGTICRILVSHRQAVLDYTTRFVVM